MAPLVQRNSTAKFAEPHLTRRACAVKCAGNIVPALPARSDPWLCLPFPDCKAGGAEIPAIGFGTSSLGNCGEIVAQALKLGYRHLDTAWKYGTERGVGEGMRAAGVPRDEIFLCTKVSHEYLHADAFARSVDESLENLGVDYVDLLLVHWPNAAIPLDETMGALAKAKRQGLTRHIGVANFNIALLDEAIRLCPEPLVNLQAECHPYLDQSKLLAACRQRGIVFTAYCPLGRGRIVGDPVLGGDRAAQGPHARPGRAALAGAAGQRHSDSALVEPRAHAREPGRLRLRADRRRDERDRRTQAAGRPHRQSGRPRAGLGLIDAPRKSGAYRPPATTRSIGFGIGAADAGA